MGMRIILAVGLGLMLAGCASEPKLLSPRIAVELPDEFNSPDGMSLDKEGNILLSCPNTNDRKHAAWIVKITPQDKLEKWFQPPLHPQTRGANPAGSGFGSDGHLYVADNQASFDPKYKSRLLRIVIEGNKPVRAEVVAEGMVLANGVACFGDHVYVTETRLDPTAPATGPMSSGVYRFAISELKADKPVVVKPGGADPHMVYKLTTVHPTRRGGANGIAFAADGTMYVCNFGDAAIDAVRFDASGKVLLARTVAKGAPMECTDGIKVCAKTGYIYVADLLGNAIHRVDPATGTIVTLAKNGLTDGAGGLLDRPSEVCLRDGRLYISNIDLPREGNVFDKPYSISVIDLKAK